MARTQFSAQVYDRQNTRELRHVKSRIQRAYDALCKEAGIIGTATGWSDPNKQFKLSDYPNAQKKIEKLLEGLSGEIQSIITDGIDAAWELSHKKNSSMVKSLAKQYGWSEERANALSRRNLASLAAFKARTDAGMHLSDRVWDFVKNDRQNIEWALELGLSEGKSAAALSRDVRQYLNEPNKLFRRVRDKHGNLVLSQAAKAYHPGRGVYRSSYKNALRLAATETNMAYRTADHEAWQKMPFVIGIEVKLSDVHATSNIQGKKYPHRYADMCDELAGVYPKDFKFTGWHPHCRCFVIAKLASRDELKKYSQLTDEQQKNYHFEGEVREAPKVYNEWIQKNELRITNASSTPYFIRDNAHYTDAAIHPEKYQVKSLVLQYDVVDSLNAFREYASTHPGSKKFQEALDKALKAQLGGNQDEFDAAMKELSKIQSTNERVAKYLKDKKAATPKEDPNKKLLEEDLAKFTKEQIKNIEDLEKALKQKRGLQMSYEKANTGRENPKYNPKYLRDPNGNYQDDKGNTYILNPKWKEKDSGYSVNCQTCTVIHELRRRGFNVEAIDNYDRKVWKIYDKQGLTNHRLGKWLDKDGNPVGYTYAYTSSKKINTKEGVEEFFEEFSKGKDGRFEISVDWKSGSAHVFCAERINGKWKFFDPQSGRMDVWHTDYALRAKLPMCGIVRTDDKLINTKLVETFIAKGELPIGKTIQITKEQRIADAAMKRHFNRTEEDKQKLTDFWNKRKQETKQLRNEMNNAIISAHNIEDAKNAVGDLEDIILGNKYSIKTKAGKTATGSIEKLKEATLGIKKIVEEYNATISEAKALAKEFAGIKGIDTSAAVNAKSIKTAKEEIEKLKAEKAKIIQEAKNITLNAKDNAWVPASELDKLNDPSKFKTLKEYKKHAENVKKMAEEADAAMTAMEDIIPDVKTKWSKKFTKEELQETIDNYYKNINKWKSKYQSDSYLKANYTEDEYLIKKSKYEAYDYLGTNMNDCQSKIKTWEAAQSSYLKLVDKTEKKIWTNASNEKIKEFVEFSKAHPKAITLAGCVKDLSDAINKYDIAMFEQKIAQAESLKNTLEKRANKAAQAKLKATAGDPNAINDLRNSQANDNQFWDAAGLAWTRKDKVFKNQAQIDEFESAVKSQDRDLVTKLLQKRGIDLTNPYDQYRKDAATWIKTCDEARSHWLDYARKAWTNGTDKEKYAAWNYTEGSCYLTQTLRGNDGFCYYTGSRKNINTITEDEINLTSWISKNKFDEDMWVKRDELSSITNDVFGIDLSKYMADYKVRYENDIKIKNNKIKIDRIEQKSSLTNNDKSFIKQLKDEINNLEAENSKLKSLIGTEGVDESFASTGNNKETLFCGGKDVMLNIYCPRGTQGIYVDPFSNFGYVNGKQNEENGLNWNGKDISDDGENEIILQRGAKLRIIKVEFNPNDYYGHGRWYIDVELVEQNPRKVVEYRHDRKSDFHGKDGWYAVFEGDK